MQAVIPVSAIMATVCADPRRLCETKGYLAHKKHPLLGPYSRTILRVLWKSGGGWGCFS